MADSKNNPQSVIPDVEYNVEGNFVTVPVPEGADAGKVLGAISEGTVGWVEDQSGVTYTAGPGIKIENGEISAHVNNYVNNQLKIDSVDYPIEHGIDSYVDPVTATVYGETQTILPYFGTCTADILEIAQTTTIDVHLEQDWVLSSGGTVNDVRYTYALVNIEDMATANYQQPYARMYVCGDVVVPVEVGSDASGPIWGFPSRWTLGFDLNWKNENLSTIDIEDVQENPSDYAFIMLHCNVDGTQLVSSDALVSITEETGPVNASWISWTTWERADDVICLSNPIPRPDMEYGGQFLKISEDGDWVFGTPDVDQTYDSTSANAQSGTAVAGALASVNQVPASTSADANKVLTVDAQGTAGWATPAAPSATYTGGAGIDIDANNAISVKLAENGGLDFKAPSVDGEAGGQAGGGTWAKKFHVGTNPQTDAVASFTLKTDLTADGKYPYFHGAAYGGNAVLVLANPTDLSQYSICASTLYGPMPYASISSKYSDYIPSNQTCTVSGPMSTLFGNSWTDYVDENGDIYLYLCDVSGNELKGTGYGPGGACAARMYSMATWNSLTLTSTLVGPAELEASVDQTYDSTSANAQSGVAVAGALAGVNQVPASTSSDEGKVLTVDAQGVPGWASAGGGGDQPLPAVGEKTLRFQFEDATYNPSTGLAVTGGTWTAVSASKGIWDFNYPQASWNSLFSGKIYSSAQACRVVDSNMTGVTSVSYLFMGCNQLKGLDLKLTDSIRSTQQLADSCSALTTASFGSTYGNGVIAISMFQGCSKLKEFKSNDAEINTFNVSSCSSMFSGCNYLRTLDFNINLRGTSDVSSMFYGCYQLRSVYIHGMSSNVNATNTFNGCHQMQIAPFMDSVNISNASGMFKSCKSLLETPNIGKCFHGCTNFSDAFNGCNSLRRINYIDTATATNVSGMFKYCTNVESGADTLYQQMSTQSTPPSSYSDCFTDCGSSTPTGTADLAQIPTSWGGTGA